VRLFSRTLFSLGVVLVENHHLGIIVLNFVFIGTASLSLLLPVEKRQQDKPSPGQYIRRLMQQGAIEHHCRTPNMMVNW